MKTAFSLLLLLNWLQTFASPPEGASKPALNRSDFTVSISVTNVIIPVDSAKVFVHVRILNASTNIIMGVGEPVCDAGAYEGLLKDDSGNFHPIGGKRNGDGPASSMNLIRQVTPSGTLECDLSFSIPRDLHPGKYNFELKRWCVGLILDANGKVQSQSRQQLVSNSLQLAIKD